MKTLNEATTKLVENISILAWIIDAEQNIIYMNTLMRDLFGPLSGQKASVIYGESSYEPVISRAGRQDGISEVVIADVHFRRISTTVDLGDEGTFILELFEDISEQRLAHINMKNALAKIYAETKTAKNIQDSILPIDDTYWETIAFSSLYKPADELGGDFYDVIKISDDEYLIYIADVMGHGIQTALITVFMRERVRANSDAALQGTDKLLKCLVHDFNSIDIEGMMYVTMALCKYSKTKRELSISNAGHGCSPLIIRDNGRSEIIPIRGMPICTLASDIDYEEEVVRINPGDRLILYTDGIIEERDSVTGHALGADGVRKLAEEHHAYSGSHLAKVIMNKSAGYAMINAKDDRSIIVADILS